MARGCSRECSTIILWMSWVTVWLITSIYVALAVIMFAKLWEAASELSLGAKALANSKIWRAPLSSLVLSAMLVFGFNMMCCVTLIKKSVNRSGPGFSYGFMVAFSISLSLFLLLSGLVLDGFRPVVKDNLEPQKDNVTGNITSGAASWSGYSSEGFVATEVLALLSFVTYFIFGFVLIFLQGAVSSQLGINEAAGYGIAPGSAAAAAAQHAPMVGGDLKDTPAAPPDYDQYAQYEQYGGGYAQDAQGQQYYDPNALGMYGQAGPQAGGAGGGALDATGGAATGYAYDSAALAGGYGPVDPSGGLAQQQGSFNNGGLGTAAGVPPPMYAPMSAGFAAIGGYNTVSSVAEVHHPGGGQVGPGAGDGGMAYGGAGSYTAGRGGAPQI